jgi:hypothetical protein
MPTSSDGVLTVTTRPYAAVGIDIAWTNPAIWQTTVKRTIGSTTVTVRSGDMAFTPGGSGFVQDNEAQIGVPAAYRAFGYSGAGVLLASSTVATVTLSSASETIWLKSVDNPHLSTEIVLAGFLAETWDADAEEFSVIAEPGASLAYPVVWQSTQQSFRGALQIETTSAVAWRAVTDVLASGVCLLSATPGNGLVRDMYLRARTRRRDRQAIVAWALDFLVADFTEVARPDTAGSPLMVPGWSYDVRDKLYASYTAADSAFPTYAALAKGP